MFIFSCVAHSPVRCGWTFFFLERSSLALALPLSPACASVAAGVCCCCCRCRRRCPLSGDIEEEEEEEEVRSRPLPLPLPLPDPLLRRPGLCRWQWVTLCALWDRDPATSLRQVVFGCACPLYAVYRFTITLTRTNRSFGRVSVVFVVLASASKRYIICLFHPRPSAAPRRLWRNLIWLECECLSECRSPARSRWRIESDRIVSDRYVWRLGAGYTGYPHYSTPRTRLGDASA